jgi:hypothetical protein
MRALSLVILALFLGQKAFAATEEIPIHKRQQDEARPGTPPPSKKRQICPQTPFKQINKEKSKSQIKSIEIKEKIIDFINSQVNFDIYINDKKITIIHAEELSGDHEMGQYSDVYRVDFRSDHILNGQETAAVLKIPNEKHRNFQCKKASQVILGYELKQYKPLLELYGDRIARHYDLDLLIENDSYDIDHAQHGFHLVEFIPDSYPIPKTQGHLNSRGSSERLADEQLAQIFQTARANSKMPLDLSRDNVRVKGGKVILIDPMHPQNDKFRLLELQSLASFAPVDSERYQFLKAAPQVP